MNRFCRNACASVVAALCFAACSGTNSAWLPQLRSGRMHVVMINGGGNKFINYQSHMLHVQDLLEILRSSGIQADDITIFSSDGSAPEADLAVRQPAKESGFWRLKGTRLTRILRPTRYESSAIEGHALHAATRAGIESWFKTRAGAFEPGDTLLLYVTDHGERNPENVRNNTITLWGAEETLSVDQLRALLDQLDPEVRVVMLMSQCFSGSFAGLAFSEQGVPDGNVCGYFSSTAKRPAYGCYAENLGRENVGHSFHFMQALVETGRFDQAHEKVLYTDATPDVPLRTSQLYLRRLLTAAARDAGVSFTDYVDQLLAKAWEDRASREPEIRQLDRIGHAFGYFSPRSLGELNLQAAGLDEVREHLATVAGAWISALGDVNAAAIQSLIEDDVTWKAQLTAEHLKELKDDALESFSRDLINDLAAHTKADPPVEDRLQTIQEREAAAAAASYRMEVRSAAVIRLRHQLAHIAGRVHLETAGTAAERRAYSSLLECEALELPIGDPNRVELVPATAYPPFDRDIEAATAALPAWLGVRFRSLRSDEAVANSVGKGAAEILAVFPDSAAGRAGMEPGDVILGPPGAPFTHANELRSWVMLSEAGKPREVDVLRDRRRLSMTMVPDPFPAKFPELPGPPQVGTTAPPIHVISYRGQKPEVGKGKAQLLVFWATWCGPCKAALPELEAYAAETGTRVVGVTDQTKKELDKFFDGGEKFLANIALDEHRSTYLAYGVSGTPTFVLIDGNGKVKSYKTGYAAAKGLEIEGWSWAKRVAR